MFGAVAHRYDFLNHLLSLGFDLTWRKATAEALRLALDGRGSVAADVCCGTGDLAFALARVTAGKVIATDFCHPMLRRAETKLAPRKRWVGASPSPGSRGLPRAIFFVEGDTLKLPFRNDSLDVVASAFGFRNLANYALGLQEMQRVLKPGGRVAILEFSQVRWPVFGSLFRFYFAHVLPRLGTWLSGVSGPYQYLPDSVSRFPDQEALAAALREAGFVEVSYRNLTGGVAALHVGRKNLDGRQAAGGNRH
jgi:demethylmenaquinone methyltransferase/2-methoxy-6-polyprenyl-1,4-benzoquinol methylase